MEQAYEWLLVGCMLVLAVLIMCCLVKAVIGPRIADRIVSVNMIGTMTIVLIAILSVYLEESYLIDVCLIYAMISFLAVVVLTRIYTGVYRERQAKKEKKEEKANGMD